MATKSEYVPGLRIREVTVEEEWSSRRKCAPSFLPRTSGCYVICDVEECLYVGSAINLLGRVYGQHQLHMGMLNGKPVEHDEISLFYIPAPRGYLCKLETDLIRHLKPKLNIKQYSGRGHGR